MISRDVIDIGYIRYLCVNGMDKIECKNIVQ